MINTFHEKLKLLMDDFVHQTYKASRNFPKDEVYGVTSQLRRAALSIILNYIEGYSRRKKLVMINFLEISYGSLKECKYLLNFCLKEDYLTEVEYKSLLKLSEEIGAMLWSTLKNIDAKK